MRCVKSSDLIFSHGKTIIAVQSILYLIPGPCVNIATVTIGARQHLFKQIAWQCQQSSLFDKIHCDLNNAFVIMFIQGVEMFHVLLLLWLLFLKASLGINLNQPTECRRFESEDFFSCASAIYLLYMYVNNVQHKAIRSKLVILNVVYMRFYAVTQMQHGMSMHLHAHKTRSIKIFNVCVNCEIFMRY